MKTSLDRVYTLLGYLVGQGELAALPARPVIRLPAALPRHLTPAEILRVEAVLTAPVAEDAGRQLDRALYYLLSHGGLRISEALELEVRDLDLAARRVRVRQGKNGRDRVALLTPGAAAALGEYLAGVPHAPADLVLSQGGRALSYEQAAARLARLGTAAGVERLGAQRLRHTYATELLNHGMRLEVLKQLMGHENMNTTLIYARLADPTVAAQYQAAMAHTEVMSANYV